MLQQFSEGASPHEAVHTALVHKSLNLRKTVLFMMQILDNLLKCLIIILSHAPTLMEDRRAILSDTPGLGIAWDWDAITGLPNPACSWS